MLKYLTLVQYCTVRCKTIIEICVIIKYQKSLKTFSYIVVCSFLRRKNAFRKKKERNFSYVAFSPLKKNTKCLSFLRPRSPDKQFSIFISFNYAYKKILDLPPKNLVRIVFCYSIGSFQLLLHITTGLRYCFLKLIERITIILQFNELKLLQGGRYYNLCNFEQYYHKYHIFKRFRDSSNIQHQISD